jgi:hypothetical protein
MQYNDESLFQQPTSDIRIHAMGKCLSNRYLTCHISIIYTNVDSACLQDARATRSLNGCWTCRLRRKKCDESHPSCSTGISLKLICYGYGPRPDWMDRGKLETDQTKRVKQIVKENTKQSRRNLQRRTLSQIATLPGHLPSPPEFPVSSASVLSSSLGATDPVRASAVRREYAPCHTSDTDPTVRGLATMDSYHNDSITLQDLISNNLEISVHP